FDFFFQAEDGIRDRNVTGVQTCALPILEVYNHVLNKDKGKIVIGARSSIFLPYQDLGLIVVDESHETTFKQFDPAPRYNARDAAVVLSHIFKSNILLGTATPSLESYYNVKHHKYGLAKLHK